jgi:hypothetical protein
VRAANAGGDRDDSLDVLVGEQLSAVTFVQDYLQLEFDGHRLTMNLWPSVRTDDGALAFGDPNYRNALCSSIGCTTTSASASDTHVEISFAPNGHLDCDLTERVDIEGDRVIFNRADGKYWNSW